MRALVLLAAGVLACTERAPRAVRVDPAAPVRVAISTERGEAVVTVEVADTPSVIAQGLMYRLSLASDHGMLFFMGRDKHWSFWMRNTVVPLDLIFITRTLTVAGIVHHARPLTDEGLRVGVRSLYVLEVNAGWAKAHGLLAGARVRFENLRL